MASVPLLLTNINPSGDGLANSHGHAVVMGGQLLFAANDGTHGSELWASDGKAAAKMVVDLVPGPDGSQPMGFSNLVGRATFSTKQGRYFTDGTAAGTWSLTALLGANGRQMSGPFINAGNSAYFFVQRTTDNVTELWKTSGGADNTAFVSAMNQPFPLSNNPEHYAYAHGAIYFIDAGPDALLRRFTLNNGETITIAGAKPLNTPYDGLLGQYGKLYFTQRLSASRETLWSINELNAAPIEIPQFNFEPSPLFYTEYAFAADGVTLLEEGHSNLLGCSYLNVFRLNVTNTWDHVNLLGTGCDNRYISSSSSNLKYMPDGLPYYENVKIDALEVLSEEFIQVVSTTTKTRQPWTKFQGNLYSSEMSVTDGVIKPTVLMTENSPLGLGKRVPRDPVYLGATKDVLFFSADADNFGRELWVIRKEKPTQGDFNDDGKIDLKDFIMLKANYGSQAAGLMQGDFDEDNDVDMLDFVRFSTVFRKQP